MNMYNTCSIMHVQKFLATYSYTVVTTYIFCCLQFSIQFRTLCPSLSIRWALHGAKLQFDHGFEQVAILCPASVQFEHWISKHFVVDAPLSRKCSSRFCFCIICIRASSFRWQVALKNSLVIILLYFSNPCWVKGSILPCMVINSCTWLATAWM